MSESYLSVAQLNTYIKNIVYGEVSSYNISNGIAYFNLKDESGLLPCVLFGATNFESPKIGDMIVVRGSMSYYARGGKLSFNAYSIMPYGKGLLYEKFLKLKKDLLLQIRSRLLLQAHWLLNLQKRTVWRLFR